MGNPYLKKGRVKSSQFSNREMNLAAVPVGTFDGGGDADGNHTNISQILRKQIPPILLIECMLEKICAMYEPVPEKQRQMYNVLRNLFSHFHLLPPTYSVPGFDTIRLCFGEHLSNLFLLAQKDIIKNAPPSASDTSIVVPSPLSGIIWNSDRIEEFLFSSRYQMDFEELEHIASGGFGAVYKARNKLDRNIYAIKKILIKSKKSQSAEKILREVQVFSQLEHTNVIAYKSAWLEYCTIETLQNLAKANSGSMSSSQGFRYFSYEFEVASTKLMETSSSSGIIFEANTNQSSVVQKAVIQELSNSNLTPVPANYFRSPGNKLALILYIQMQLCPQTLRQWLSKRNITELKNIDSELKIFRGIMQGVHHIHEKGIVHRDMKPENIFINETTGQAQIGDFGLARLELNNEATNGNVASTSRGRPYSSSHSPTRGVGTRSYAAPEQLNSNDYGAKSDLYSLGIILLELVIPFRTEMERHKTLTVLREKHQVPQYLMEKWPEIGELIKDLIAQDPNKRPSAAQVLNRLKEFESALKQRSSTYDARTANQEIQYEDVSLERKKWQQERAQWFNEKEQLQREKEELLHLLALKDKKIEDLEKKLSLYQ